MPGPVDAVEVDERQPAGPDDLEVVALDRVAPPRLRHPPAVADLDRLRAGRSSGSRPARRRRPARPRSTGARGAGGSSEPHGRHVQRVLGQRRVRVGDRDPPDPVLAERQGEPGELPAEPGIPGRLRARTAGAADRPPARPRPARARAARPAPAAASARGGRRGAARSPRRRRSARGSAARRRARPGSRPGRRRGRGSGGGGRGRRPCRGPGAGRRARRRADGGRTGAGRAPPTGGSIGRARRVAPGPAAAGTAAISSPRARAWIRSPSSPNRATSADRGSSATAPIRRSPNRAEAGPDVRVRGEQRGRQRGEEGGLAAGPDDPRLRRRGVGGGDRRREPGPGDPRPRGARAGSAPSASTSRPTSSGSLPHSRSSPSTWTSSSPNAGSAWSVVPASPGLNRASVSKAASTAAASASGSGSRKAASGASRWALPSGIPRRTPSARAAGSASITVPSVHGWPPRTTGRSVGNESEWRARASRSGRWGQ